MVYVQQMKVTLKQHNNKQDEYIFTGDSYRMKRRLNNIKHIFHLITILIHDWNSTKVSNLTIIKATLNQLHFILLKEHC